jgi:hypothetical protein
MAFRAVITANVLRVRGKGVAMKKKRTNPNRVPVTKADLNRAKKEATDESVGFAWAIFFSVMRDKEGYSRDDLQRLWGEVESLCDSITKGYVNIADLMNTLKEEDGIRLI